MLDIHGIGLYSALLIVAEIGEVERFRTAKQVGAYTGLTSRVHQSGGHCYQGSITRQGSPWLRWVLVQAAMKAVHRDDRVEELLQPHPQTIRREDRAGGGGEKTRGDLLETVAAVASRARQPGRLKADMSFRAPTRLRVARKRD